LPTGGQDAIRRILLNDDGGPKTLLKVIQEKNVTQGKTPTVPADLRFGDGPDGQVSLTNKHDGTIRLADMVRAGMTPHQVIVAATRNSAEFMRLPDLGTVEAGKSADFLVLDANPLDDITNTRRINAVYMRGAAVDRPALRAGWATTATQ
jgi:cytosine/adenosine deaminase-related metal-dependent hydrolase